MIADDAFQQGYDAYWDGVDPDDNPHLAESEEHFRWDEGWAQAQLDDEETDIA